MTNFSFDESKNTPVCDTVEEAVGLYSTIKPKEISSLRMWLNHEMAFFRLQHEISIAEDNEKLLDLQMKSAAFDKIGQIEIFVEELLLDEQRLNDQRALEILSDCTTLIKGVNACYFEKFAIEITKSLWDQEANSMFAVAIKVATKFERLTTLIYSLMKIASERNH